MESDSERLLAPNSKLLGGSSTDLEVPVCTSATLRQRRTDREDGRVLESVILLFHPPMRLKETVSAIRPAYADRSPLAF